MKLALSILCEHPTRKTGLSSLFHEFVAHALQLEPETEWIVFAGPRQAWEIEDSRVRVIRDFPANDRLIPRLFADHFLVPARARQLGADALLTVGFAPARACLPLVMHVFSLQHLNEKNRLGAARTFYRRIAVPRGLRKAQLIITNSEFAAQQITSVEPACRDRLLVSHEGLQHDQFFPLPDPRLNAAEAEKIHAAFQVRPGYLLWVSNFYHYKGADRLLRAYARLRPELRQRHPLVMVGGWAAGRAAAESLVRDLGIEEDVRFLGWIEDRWLAPLYRQARGFCLASREETFGRCVIEAMACGTPTVVNAIPIMHEVTGGHALIVDFDDTDAVARALATLCKDDAVHARLSMAGQSWVQRYSFDKLAGERLAAIRACIAGKFSPPDSALDKAATRTCNSLE